MIAEFVRLSAMYLVVYVYIRQTWNREAAMMVKWLATVSLGLMVLSSVMGSQILSELHLALTTYTQGREAVNKGLPGVLDFIKGGWGMPMKGQITQPFKEGVHHGIDIAAPEGTPVEAVGKGQVTSIGWSDIYGNYIIINHGKGIESLYGHLSGWNVNVGYPVVAGKVIGACGSTGNSTGFHLHFEIRLNGIAQNPMNYLK